MWRVRQKTPCITDRGQYSAQFAKFDTDALLLCIEKTVGKIQKLQFEIEAIQDNPPPLGSSQVNEVVLKNEGRNYFFMSVIEIFVYPLYTQTKVS